MSKLRPYGYFPARRRRNISPTPEPVPDGEYARFWGACVSVPTTGEDVRALAHSDFKATCALTISDSGTNRDKPWFAYACPTAYGVVGSMASSGLSLDYDSQTLSLDGVEYRLVCTPYEQWDGIALSFS